MPTFEWKVCGKKIEADCEICDCTHAYICHEQKNLECCDQQMQETIED
jgi:hypothetical protein